MKILEAKRVENDNTEREKESVRRIEGLRDAEKKAIASLNQTRDQYEGEIRKLSSQAEEKRKKIIAELAKLDSQISARRSELRDLMRPIADLKKKAEKNLAEAEAIRRAASDELAQLSDKREELARSFENIVDREALAAEEKTRLNERERRLLSAEREMQERASKIAEEWVNFYKKVHSANIDIEKRERDISAAERSNENYAAELIQKGEDLRIREDRLRDRQEELHRAWHELKTK